jgi:hypothetical protein
MRQESFWLLPWLRSSLQHSACDAHAALHSSKVVAEPSAAGGTPNWASARSSSNSMMASSDRLAMYAHVDVGAPLSFGGGLARRTWRRRRKCEMTRGHTPVAKSANSPRT